VIVVGLRLATFNVENLFARAKAFDTDTWAEGEPALAAFQEFNRIAAKPTYSAADKAAMLAALEALRILVRTPQGLRVNPRSFDDAWAVLRENRGDFLVAPTTAEPRIDAAGRAAWNGCGELTTEPVDEVATRMTARVITDLAADVLCVVEAEDRPSLLRFNTELLDGRGLSVVWGRGPGLGARPSSRPVSTALQCVMFVVLLTYTASLDEIDATLPAHAEWLQQQYEAGYFLVSGRQVPRVGGVIIAREMVREELEALLATDPFAVHKLAAYQMVEFQVTQTAPELADVREVG
jgi:uncharacterized protein YciI